MIAINVSIQEALRAYYKDTDVPIDEAEKAHVIAMLPHEAAGFCFGAGDFDTTDAMPFWRFLIGQLRFVNPVAWVAQIALLVGMLAVVSAFSESESSMLIVMAAAVLSVAMAVPSVFKSFESNVSELEAACRHDSAQVLVCRLTLFGLADVLWMSLAAGLVPALANGDPIRVFLYAATPYFAFCALCFYLSRKLRGRGDKACAGAACCVVVALWAINTTLPHWYAEASVLVWFVALAASLALAVYEARRLISEVATDSLTRVPYFA